LATLIVSPATTSRDQASFEIERRRQERRISIGVVTALAFFALAVHGYHPYAEDGGIYIVGIKHTLFPSIYPQWTEFTVSHPRFSLFTVFIAALAKFSHVNLDVLLFVVHFISQWLTLFAAWCLMSLCSSRQAEKIGAVALLATWLTLPVAGTSILLMDPYVTARSISTPCSLFALYGILLFQSRLSLPQTKRWQGLALCCGALIIAALMHPLMAAYALGWVLILGLQLSEDKKVRDLGTSGLVFLALLLAWTFLKNAPAETQAHLQAEMTRSYWFLSNWTWYEKVGIVAPLIILALFASQNFERKKEKVALARMAIICPLTAVIVSLLFGRINSSSHIVAWLQPLRILQITYILLALFLGATLGGYFLKREKGRWLIVFSLLASIMFFAERCTFPDSAHFEFPGSTPRNQWVKAFLWVKSNTPKQALFALDSDYIIQSGEDAQNFRAISERSSLPDSIKDGGDAANNSKLASAWAQVQKAQKGLSEKSDFQRIEGLKPLGVNWVILRGDAKTDFSCFYRNGAVKICQLPFNK
jgi:hypothetical protein